MVKAVVGANWGDEGKGKITDMLAEKAELLYLQISLSALWHVRYISSDPWISADLPEKG